MLILLLPAELPNILSTLKETIAAHGLDAKKSLGQHFLLDGNLTARIAQAAGDLTSGTTIEIGPGPGGLTRALLAAGAHVVAVEKDRRCLAALEELKAAYPTQLSLVEADAMKVDLPSLGPAPRRIVANLPYNVGTALLVQWLEQIAKFFEVRHPEQREGSGALPEVLRSAQDDAPYASLTLMFQREVADRIAASPNSKEYGRLSVFAQWLCTITHHFDLPPGAFSPPPKIHSSVITLTPRLAPLCPADKETLEKILQAAFGQRRKMLRQSLKTFHADAAGLLAAANIDGTRRAEDLSVAEFCALARAKA